MNKILVSFLVLFFILGCDIESVDYPPEPYVEFKDVIVENSVDLLDNPIRNVSLHFYLIDGDGDIGPLLENTEIYRNCNWELYYFNNNERMHDTMLHDSIIWVDIPSAGELGQDQSLKADVFITIEFTSAPQSTYDTFQFSIQVFDMALNESNIAWSDTIIFVE
ncbi:MAG: hypothetical protein JEZ09_01205 [Salinivirgaceae bacterium]|nr:hypothetical protein [Salinivirgaceae bacterium]